MPLTLNELIKTLVDKEELDCVKALITLKESKYAEAIDKVLELDDSILPAVLASSNLNLPSPSTTTPTLNNVIEFQQPNYSSSSSEVFTLSQFKDDVKVKVDKAEETFPTLEMKVFKKLSIEQQMVLLTIAWAQKPSPSSYLIKHCQRISSFFNLHKDDRWRTYYSNNRTKMQTLITNSILRFKNSGLVIETKMSNINKHSVYQISELGLSVSRIIAHRVGFSLDTAI